MRSALLAFRNENVHKPCGFLPRSGCRLACPPLGDVVDGEGHAGHPPFLTEIPDRLDQGLEHNVAIIRVSAADMKIRDVQPGDLHSEPNLYRTLEHSISGFHLGLVESAKGFEKVT